MDTPNALTTTPFEEMEKADEQMVLDEIKGRSLDALIYEIQQRGQTITGLSLAGVRETARVMNQNGKSRIGMSEREPIITETEDYFEVKAYAQDTLNGGGYWGIKRQDKRYRNGENPFALEQALAKAQRNALRGLIPEWFVKEMIDAWRKQGKVKTIEQSSTPMPKNALPTGPGIQTHKTDNGDGEGAPSKHTRAVVQTPKWTDLLKRAVSLEYVPDDTMPSAIRLLNVVGAAGISSVNDLNLDACWNAIESHYEAKKQQN